MHVLAVYAHPSRKSFNHAILDAVREEVTAKGHECMVRDLYGSGFQPSLSEADFESFNHGAVPADIKGEQDAVGLADVVVFIHPVWWFGPPAIFKGWVDRVFSYGFAYGHDSRGVKPLLAGKKAIIINTTGEAEATGYVATGYRDAIVKLVDGGIYEFVGFDIILRRMFFQVPAASDEERRGMLSLLRSDMRKLF